MERNQQNNLDRAIYIISKALERIKELHPEQGMVGSECFQIDILTRKLLEKYREQDGENDEKG